MALELRFARRDEYSRISQFLEQHWARNYVYSRMPQLFDWTFSRPGPWKGGYSFSLAEDSGELIGVLGGISFRLNRFGTSSDAVWIVNYVIDAEHRKGTNALKLLGSFRRPEFSAVVAAGINRATATIYQVLRGQVLPDLPRHALVLPGRSARLRQLISAAYPEWPELRAQALAEACEIRRKLPSTNPERTLPADWDERDWPEIAAQTMGAARDAEYLKWRYQQHPIFPYRFLVVREGHRSGLAVWRLETIHREVDGRRQPVDRIGRLVEFLPASASNAEVLLGTFLNELEQGGAIGADYYGYHGETRGWLRDLGFFDLGLHPDGAALPSRFQPLDGKGGGIASAIFIQDTSAPSDSPSCPWYWTKSDSDQDRPN